MGITDDFLTVKQVAERLHVSPKRAYAIVAAGLVPSVRVGQRKRMVPVAAWEQWCRAQSELALRRCGEVAERAS